MAATPSWMTGYAPTGYTGGVRSPIPLYGGAEAGATAGMGGLLGRMLAMRERLAEAELRALQEDILGKRWGRQMGEREFAETKKLTDEERRERQRLRAEETQIGHAGSETQRMQAMRDAAQTLGLMQRGQGGGSPNIIRGTTEQMGLASPYLAALAGLGLGTGSTDAGPMPSYEPTPGQMRAQGYQFEEEPRFTRTPSRWEQQGYQPLPSYARSPFTSRMSASRILGSREAGGTIPETGAYKLHKGELVIPRKDVSPALVNMLIRKKLTERAVPKGSPSGASLGSYQGGSAEALVRMAEAGDTPSFREILRSGGMQDSHIEQTIRQLNRNARGQMLTRAQIGENFKNFLRSGALVPAGLPMAPGAFKAMSKRGFAPGAFRAAAEPALRAGGREAAALARGGGKYGKVVAGGLLGAGALAAGLGPEPEPPEEPSDLRQLIEKMPWWAETFIPQARMAGGIGRMVAGTQEGKSVPEAVGAAFREQFRGAAQPLIGAAGGAIKGVTGVDLNVPMTPSGPPEAAPAPAEELGRLVVEGGGPEGPAEGTYEAASARARAGDFGTAERPLVLRGELSDIEQAQRDIERIPQYRAAKEKAERAEQEADSMFTMLASEGRSFDPQVYADLQREAERKMKLAKSFRAIMESHEKASQSILAESREMAMAINRDIIREGAIGDRQAMLENLRLKGTFSTANMRAAVSSLPRMWAIYATGSPREKAEAEQVIAWNLQQIAMAEELRATDPETRATLRAFGENAEANTREFLSYDEARVQELVERLLQQYSGAAELSETMGGVP